jgi:hypothetical protein
MKYLFNYTENNPLVINDYPYGFNQRTQIRYWIETTPKKGDRFCSQTLNPKNNIWNKPKKSTYSEIGIMTEGENGYISWESVSNFDIGEKTLAFVNKIGGIEKLNPHQFTMYKQLTGGTIESNDKPFTVKWVKDSEGKCDEVNIKFNRPDGVKLIEIFEAMKSLNQSKLNEVFEVRDYGSLGKHAGTVRILVNKGYQLGSISKEQYEKYLKTIAVPQTNE